MRRFYLIFSILFLLYHCNDGDVITVSLNFDEMLSLCGTVDTEHIDTDNYILYDTKSDPFEALILQIPGSTANDRIFDPEITPYQNTININGSSVRFIYRTYDADPTTTICDDIDDASVNIINDYEATSGTITYATTFLDDDNDGIASNLEDDNLDGDNDYLTNPRDTDGDGIEDYRDTDDDNDNVPTINENPDPDADGDLSDAQNTDGDSLPDYLDPDDDDDGVITRYEDENLDNSPLNDFAPGSTIVRYLDNTAVDSYINNNLRDNIYTRNVISYFEIINTDLVILNTDLITFGTRTGSIERDSAND